jgi:hypothetical protein
MPLAQTVNSDCFVKYVRMFGFEIHSRSPFGFPYHKREGFLFKKVQDFDPRYLQMPQATGKINNFLIERDWFMQ